jgi:hypothetical protein
MRFDLPAHQKGGIMRGATLLRTDQPEGVSALTGANSLRWKHDILMGDPFWQKGMSVSNDRFCPFGPRARIAAWSFSSIHASSG